MTKPKKVTVAALRMVQPIGDFYVACIKSDILHQMAYSDIRSLQGGNGRELDSYLGIQRELNSKRVKEISNYVNSVDACFPTGIILSVDEKCIDYDEARNTLSLYEYVGKRPSESIEFSKIAKILDGQHRLEGLKDFRGNNFDINVSIFVGADISTQANIFATVNLAQTKVNKSLVYDLYDLAVKRSPQKSCHLIAVALDQNKNSPFFKSIKRLGSATPGREYETITQANFVESLLPHLTEDAVGDRNVFMSGGEPRMPNKEEMEKMIFRKMFLKKEELLIADVVFNYYSAIKSRWNLAWKSQAKGSMLTKTNGFRAFMRFLRNAKLQISGPGEIPTEGDFLSLLKKVTLRDNDFSVDNFKPGTSGEAKLFQHLIHTIE